MESRVGSSFALGVDGISLPMVLLFTLLCLIAVLASGGIRVGARLYFSLLLVLEASMLGVFMARDWSLFYRLLGIHADPAVFLIDRMGNNRHRAALNFVLYTLGGSVFMLVALLLLYDAAPGHSFAMADMIAGGIRPAAGNAAARLCRTVRRLRCEDARLPDAWLVAAGTRRGPSPISILLSGVLLKMGAYGLIRAAETLPQAVLTLQSALAALALVSLVLRQRAGLATDRSEAHGGLLVGGAWGS